MSTLRPVEKLEVISIPIMFFFSWLFLSILSIIVFGADNWTLIILPLITGMIIGTTIFLVLEYKKIIVVTEFKQLETVIRGTSITSGLSLIVTILFQWLIKIDMFISVIILIVLFGLVGMLIFLSSIMLYYRAVIKR